MNAPQQQPTRPLIVGFVADLMFTTRIEQTAERLGYRVQWVGRADDFGAADAADPQESPGELLLGRGGRLFEKITAWQPALLLFDLTNSAVPWSRWIPALKSSPATRRIPLLCFGPHTDVATMKEARRLGADQVLARSRFVSDMPGLLRQHMRVPDWSALANACAEPLAPLAREGIDLFNQGAFYRCHDALEEAWMADDSPGRDLYRGILQTGIALYQVQRGNYRGAVKMLLRVRQWLDPLPPRCRGVDVQSVRDNLAEIHQQVTALGPDGLDGFDWQLVRPIQLTE